MEDIQQQIDDIVSRLDENDSSQQDFSDTLDSSMNDLQTLIDENSTNIDQLTEDSGQLAFPLTQDTIDLIKEIYPTGFITLVGGTATLIDGRISANSNILLTASTVAGTQGILSYAAIAGQAVINSSQAGDISTISYLILN